MAISTIERNLPERKNHDSRIARMHIRKRGDAGRDDIAIPQDFVSQIKLRKRGEIIVVHNPYSGAIPLIVNAFQ